MTHVSSREAGMRTIEDLHGPAGRLEALLNPPVVPALPFAVLLCHPHPLFGGTFHNKVVYHAMKTFIGLGFPLLRFNFRGAGRSEGVHDNGIGEQQDVRAALDWLDAEYRLPILAAGFSFGAHMALRAGCADERVAGLVSLGTPVQAADRTYTYEFLSGCRKPKLFLSGSADEFGPVAKLEAALACAAEPKQLIWITNAGHFFTGALDMLQSALRGWLEANFVPLQEPHTLRRQVSGSEEHAS
jgi:alpha/beta superfamily hydrolase